MTIPIPGLSSLSGRSKGRSGREAMKKRLRAIAALPTNRICADCPEAEPTWASLQIDKRVAVLCCYQCCKFHHQLGKDVCKVKNIKMVDEWTIAEIETIERGGGNDIVNFIYEAGLSSAVYDKLKVLEDEEDDAAARKEFIRLKYKDLRYFDQDLYKTQIPDAQPTSYVQSNGVMVPVPVVPRATKKMSKRSKSHEVSHCIPSGSYRGNASNTNNPPPRSVRSFHEPNRNEDLEIEDMDDSSACVGYSLPGHLGVQARAPALSLGKAKNKKEKRRGSQRGSTPSHEDLGYGSDSSKGSTGRNRGFPPRERRRSSTASTSKYVPMQDCNPTLEDLGYGNMDAVDSRSSMSGSSAGRRMQQRRSSAATSGYMPVTDTSLSREDLGYGPMDASMGSISGTTKKLPPRERRRSSRSTASTASLSLPSSLSTIGSSEVGRWDESSQLLQTNKESWSMEDSIKPATRWNSDSPTDRWNSSADLSSSDRWITDFPSCPGLDQSEATHRTETTLPRSNRRRRDSMGKPDRPLSAPRRSSMAGTDNNVPANNRRRRTSIGKPDQPLSVPRRKANEETAESVAPRMPRRMVSDSSGEDTDAKAARKDPSNREALPDGSKGFSGCLRRMSLPAFASNTYEDEDSILDQYGEQKPIVVVKKPIRRGSLGMRKEKAAPKYGVKMGYGFDSSKESDSEQESKSKEEAVKEKNLLPLPRSSLTREEEEEELGIEAPALGTFLEKSMELPNRILGGGSISSSTKSSNEDIMGIGPRKPGLSRVNRAKSGGAKSACLAMMAKAEQDGQVTSEKRPSALTVGECQDRPTRRGSLADHFSHNESGDEFPSDVKSLSGFSTGRSVYTGYSFGSNSTNSSGDLLLTIPKPPVTKAKPGSLESSFARSSLHTASDDSSLAAFSQSSSASSVTSEEDRRRAYTLAKLRASGRAA